MASTTSPSKSGPTRSDGRETWLIHNYLYENELDFDAIDRDASIRTILGVGPEFEYEVISKEDWIGRRLVADRFRDRRVFICGDSAHLWVPYAGYGMNAGIADAMNLALIMPAAERKERYVALKEKVFRTTAEVYCQRFIEALEAPESTRAAA